MASVRYDFSWERNKVQVYKILTDYFGISSEKIDALTKKNFQTKHDLQKFVASVAGLAGVCKKGQTVAEASTLENNNLVERRKSGEALLSKLKFHDEEQPNDIYLRVKSLFTAINEKGIDIYKTIYMTTLTDGNFRSFPNLKKDSFETDRGDDRDFDSIYNALQSTLRLSGEETNKLIEKCPATIIAKVKASNIKEMYTDMLMKLGLVNPEVNKRYYFFRADDVDVPRRESSSKMITEGLVNCPTIFDTSFYTVSRAFDYIAEKVPEDRIMQEHEEFLAKGNTTMTPFWCKFRILRSWINDNFSILTINADKMRQKERWIRNELESKFVAKDKDGYIILGENSRPKRNYNLSFLFDNPVSISTINSIPIEKMEANAEGNILLLEQYANIYSKSDEDMARGGVRKLVRDYLKSNHYALAMDNDKLSSLLRKIYDADKENSNKALFERFLKLGKSLFANKHNIDFDVDLVFAKLSKRDEIQILDVSSMSDWERVEKFVELFCGNDIKIVATLRKLHQEKLAKDNQGGKQLRKQIRTIVSQEGGWERILKDKDASLAMAGKIGEITNKRFEIEKVPRTNSFFDDMSELKIREREFTEKINQTLGTLKRAYSEKKDRLNKRYTDVDKLYNYAMMFLERECFDDKEPIANLFNEEIASTFEEALKNHNGAYADDQQSIFGESKLIVPVEHGMVQPIKELAKAIKANDSFDSRQIKIERNPRYGK